MVFVLLYPNPHSPHPGNAWWGTTHSMYWQERQLSCLRRDHKPSKTPKVASDWFPRPWTKDWMWCKGMQQIRACGKGQCKTSQTEEVPGCSQLAWTCIKPLNSVFYGTITAKKTRRGSTGCCWNPNRVVIFSTHSDCHLLLYSFFFYFFLSLSPTHIYC